MSDRSGPDGGDHHPDRSATDPSVLTEIMTLIAGGASLGDVLDAIVRSVEDRQPDMLCSILLMDESRRHLIHGAAPSLSSEYASAIDGVEIGASVGSCGTAAYTGERVIVTDIAHDPLWANYKGLAAAAGLASCWSQPIKDVGGRVLVTFAIYHRTTRGPTDADIRTINDTAHLAAIAIERKLSSDALQASEARAQRAAEVEQDAARGLTTFFDVSLDLLAIRDLEGRFVKANQSWEVVMGYTPEQLRGMHLINLVHPDDVEPTVQQMKHIDADGAVIGFVNR